MKQSVVLRKNIKKLILNKDYEKLLERAAEFHGHYCPYLALGVKASLRGLNELNIYENYGFEELLAIIEINSCFVDGIQVVSGCTFGNNGLIFKDIGKTGVTFISRNSKKAVRISVRKREDWAEWRSVSSSENNKKMLEQILENKPDDLGTKSKLLEIYKTNTLRIFDAPDEKVFLIKKVIVNIPEYAPIKASVTCSVCEEEIMESKATFKEEKPICRACANEYYFKVDGSGISRTNV